MKRQSKKRVVIAFPQHMAYLERLLQGILAYARQGGKWSILRMPEIQSASLGWLRHWQGDGAFVLITSALDARIARSLAKPVVNLAALVKATGIPSVMVDHRAVGQFAAEHLLSRNFRHFGFFGSQGRRFSELRRDGFRETVLAAGATCSVLEVPLLTDSRVRWVNQQEQLAEWVRKLPLPVGVMACNDPRAGMVLDAGLEAGLRVPEDLAVIGADNDPVACEGCAVPLSSVARQDHEVGFQAAALLDRLMAGESPPDVPMLIPPEGVIQRRSTDTHALDDPQLAAAVKYVHEHVHEPFGVERLLEMVRLSRRRFELRFKHSLGCTPYDFIVRRRVEEASRLLAGPGHDHLTEIATACGFTNLRHLRISFRRVTGMSPSQYRKKATRLT
jgi:LacI family transcriptional regulator